MNCLLWRGHTAGRLQVGKDADREEVSACFGSWLPRVKAVAVKIMLQMNLDLRKILVTPKIFLKLRVFFIINAGFCLLHSDGPLYFHVHYGISLWKVLVQSRRWSFATANHQVLLPKMVGFCCFSYSLEQHFYEAKIAPKFGCLQTFFSALFLVEGQWMNVFIGVISASLWIQMRYTDTRGTW